mmetsp:Transcript_30127/g.50923  ORF Transcript_30127/g.50923 Transcript_30127/m.50923 type:complete len:213 (-) Transcript_30127:939-1577(-)
MEVLFCNNQKEQIIIFLCLITRAAININTTTSTSSTPIITIAATTCILSLVLAQLLLGTFRGGCRRCFFVIHALLLPLLPCQSTLCCSCVCLESFDTRERHAVPHHLLRCGGLLVRDVHPRTHTQKREHTQASRVSRCATRGEHVVRPGPIVPQHLGGNFSDKDRPIAAALLRHGLRLRGMDFQVLRPNCVRNFHRRGDIWTHTCKSFFHRL